VRNMEPVQELSEQLDQERVLRARSMSLEEKFLLGAELFDYACRITLDGIRSQFPDADEARVREILEERLRLQRQLEERL
jgi:hypothetical protein